MHYATVGRKSGLWVADVVGNPQKRRVYGVCLGSIQWVNKNIKEIKKMSSEKKKFALYVKESTLDVARQWYAQDPGSFPPIVLPNPNSISLLK